MRIATLFVLAGLAACTPSTGPESPQSASVAGSATPAQNEASTKPNETEASIQKATAEIGKPAPDFTLTDLDGKEHSLAAYKGKTVVLEWFNPGCPYVVAAYDGGPMKAMAEEYMEKDVVWLAVNSGAPGKQGHGAQVNREATTSWSMPQPVLLDPEGTVGRAYGARTTPHMYVINPEGHLVYSGALDNAPRNKVPDVGHVHYTRDALQATLAGEPVKAAQTQAWGCSVKYGG